jgi:hypothetical protein
LIDPLFCPHPLIFFILCVGVFDTSYLYVAESAFATTIAATDADDVAIMLIESEGNFNQAMAMGNMLRGAAGVVSLCNNNDSFYEAKASLAQCTKLGRCITNTDCCEYK